MPPPTDLYEPKPGKLSRSLKLAKDEWEESKRESERESKENKQSKPQISGEDQIKLTGTESKTDNAPSNERLGTGTDEAKSAHASSIIEKGGQDDLPQGNVTFGKNELQGNQNQDKGKEITVQQVSESNISN